MDVLDPERRSDKVLARPRGDSPPGEPPTIVFVFGMGRSGTSALARALSLCGGVLPDTLLGADDGNPRGYWEPRIAVHLNDEFLRRHGSTWFDPTLRFQDEVVVSGAERDAYLGRIKAFLRGLPSAPLHIIKEPRITALSDFWFDAARQIGFRLAAAVPVRHPGEVSASLAARYRMSPELATALWLKYNVLAERYSRGLPRVFIEYSSFLRDWRAEVSRIEAALRRRPVAPERSRQRITSCRRTCDASVMGQGYRKCSASGGFPGCTPYCRRRPVTSLSTRAPWT